MAILRKFIYSITVDNIVNMIIYVNLIVYFLITISLTSMPVVFGQQKIDFVTTPNLLNKDNQSTLSIKYNDTDIRDMGSSGY